MKRIFRIDWLLLLAFLLSAFSGIALHMAGHGSSHDVWHHWAVVHVVTSAACLVLAALHVATHWAWYKSLISSGIAKRSKLTLLLTIVFLLLVVTGLIVLVRHGGANTVLGVWHYRIGLLTIALALIHVIARRKPLFRSLRRTPKQ